MTPTIIAAIDPLTRDRAPVDLAVTVGAATGAPVLAAAVYPWSMSDEPGKLSEFRRFLGVDTRILNDVSPARALHEFADELGAALIVVGSSSQGAVARALTGTTAEHVAHGSPCATALAPHSYHPAPIRTIAVGFVDTPEGHAALDAAYAMAASAGARLHVIVALHPSGSFDASGRAVAALGAGVDVEMEHYAGEPADVLIGISRHVDLLVCGSRDHGAVRSVVLGSVSRRLLQDARCPVLVIPHGMERPLEDLIPSHEASIGR